MLFVVCALIAIVWSVCVLRWCFSIRGRGRTAVLVMTYIAAAAALASAVADVRTIRAESGATDSRLAIGIVRRGDWFELDYVRSGASFVTANEMHVPEGSVVSLQWTGCPQPSIEGAACVSPEANRCGLITGTARETEALFVALHPLVHQRLRVVVDPLPRFESWFRQQMQPAPPSAEGAALFTSAGCVYCHVIRGVVASATQIAPDLTHFASRKTIAGTPYATTKGTLTGWIANSRGLKPTSSMPPNAIAPPVLHRLVDYVRSLR